MNKRAKAAAERVKQAYRSFEFDHLELLDDAMILVEELEELNDTTPDSYPEPYCPHCDEES